MQRRLRKLYHRSTTAFSQRILFCRYSVRTGETGADARMPYPLLPLESLLSGTALFSGCPDPDTSYSRGFSWIITHSISSNLPTSLPTRLERWRAGTRDPLGAEYLFSLTIFLAVPLWRHTRVEQKSRLKCDLSHSSCTRVSLLLPRSSNMPHYSYQYDGRHSSSSNWEPDVCRTSENYQTTDTSQPLWKEINNSSELAVS